jgi:hypothetical protein
MNLNAGQILPQGAQGLCQEIHTFLPLKAADIQQATTSRREHSRSDLERQPPGRREEPTPPPADPFDLLGQVPAIGQAEGSILQDPADHPFPEGITPPPPDVRP